MSNFLNTLSTLILLSSIVFMANKRTKSYIKTFRVQSVLIALAAGIMGVKNLIEYGHIDLLVVCLIIIILKVIYIPNILNDTDVKVEYKVEKDYILSIPTLVIVSCALVVFTYFSISHIEGLNEDSVNMPLVNSISIILIGLFFMISRKKVIGQIIGFLVIENGLFVTAMFVTDGMPFVVDMGIFIDIITAVLIMGIMVFRISEEFESTNTDKMKSLKG